MTISSWRPLHQRWQCLLQVGGLLCPSGGPRLSNIVVTTRRAWGQRPWEHQCCRGASPLPTCGPKQRTHLTVLGPRKGINWWYFEIKFFVLCMHVIWGGFIFRTFDYIFIYFKFYIFCTILTRKKEGFRVISVIHFNGWIRKVRADLKILLQKLVSFTCYRTTLAAESEAQLSRLKTLYTKR